MLKIIKKLFVRRKPGPTRGRISPGRKAPSAETKRKAIIKATVVRGENSQYGPAGRVETYAKEVELD